MGCFINKYFFSLCLILTLFKGIAFPAGVSVVQSINFGKIVASPDGEVIEINAKNGPAVPVVFSSGSSYINGGFSGLIRVSSDIPGQMINIIYPVSVNLTASGASNMTLDGMDSRSGTSATSIAVEDIDFDVGGLLHIGNGQKSQTYSATITVTIDIINP